MAEALLIILALDYALQVPLPLVLASVLRKASRDLVHSSKFVIGITRKLVGARVNQPNSNIKKPLNKTEQITTHNDLKLNKGHEPISAVEGQAQSSPKPKSNHRGFLRAPVSKGPPNTCRVHKNSVVGCATFFDHNNYEYKLLCHGKLYFRPKGTHMFRNGPVVPKTPGNLFAVKLDNTGSNVVTFCFGPGSRALGEVNGYAEFRPVRTRIASSQEAHGLEYVPGQGCVFDWVYGTCPSPEYPWDYNRLYDVGWMHSSPTTEEQFISSEEAPAEQCALFADHSHSTLWQSLEGLDLDIVNRSPMLDNLGGEIQVGLAHVELNDRVYQHANNAQLLPSSSGAPPSLPVPLTPIHHSAAWTSTDSPAASKSVLRRTCTICNRVLRRPSALTLHKYHKPSATPADEAHKRRKVGSE
ncbi:hypothetical protein RhiTH_005869 [Rhizoctonia solani]